MDASVPERVRAGSSAWQIVDLGAETWEVVTRDTRAADADASAATADAGSTVTADGGVLRIEEIDQRLAALELRLGAVDETESRVGELERAHRRTHERITGLERGQAEVESRLEARDAALREEMAEIYRDAARAVAETQPEGERKPKWLQRRHELKLLRLERDRKMRQAERRLVERSHESLERIERRVLNAEEGVREVGVAAELGVQATAGKLSTTLRRKLDALTSSERRLEALLERIDESEKRLRFAIERIEIRRTPELQGHWAPQRFDRR